MTGIAKSGYPPVEGALALGVPPARIAGWLGLIAALLAIAHTGFVILRRVFDYDYVFGLAPLFDFQLENTVPAYFSALLLMGAAVLLGVLGTALKQADRRWAGYWLGLAIVFTFLSFDEQLALHERLMFPVRTALNTSGLLYSAWVIPYGIALLALAAIYLRFLLAIHPVTRRRFIVAAALFLTGAIVLEALSGVEWEQFKTRTALLDGYILFEDLFEMAGAIVFIHALLHELARENAAIWFARGPDRA